MEKEVVERLELQAILKVRNIDSAKEKKRQTQSHGSESLGEKKE